MAESKFKEGARVAVDATPRFHNGPLVIKEDFVLKVHKTGNFTLKSRPGDQWRPWGDGTTAMRAGNDRYATGRVEIWDETTDAKISAAIAYSKRVRRFKEAMQYLNSFPVSGLKVFDEDAELALTILEAAVIKLKEAVKEE